MRSLGLAERFMQPIQILDGPLTRGVIHTVAEGGEPGFNYAYETTTLRVRRDSLIQSGQVIEASKTGVKYLVADLDIRPSYRVHRLLRADRQVSWSRKGEVRHPLTNEVISNNSDPEPLGDVWVLWNMTRADSPDLVTRMSDDSHMVATVADVELGDFLDGQEVKRINRALGLNIVEVQ